MSKFLTSLKLEVGATDGDYWTVLEDLVYSSDVANMTITVPAGFKTDLASVPRLPVVYWLTGATSNEAAVVHDFLYSMPKFPRALADAVLREASEVTGVPWWRRQAMWSAVRLFGGFVRGEAKAVTAEDRRDWIN